MSSGALVLAGSNTQVGGVNVGQAGAAGTIYENHILSWAEDFTGPLNIVGPSNQKGKYFASKGYSAGTRGNNTQLGESWDVDPLYTGYLDSNRGVPVGYNNLNVANSILTLGSRLATTAEQAGLPATDPTLNGGVRPIVSSMLHTEGAISFYPGSNATVIVEAFVKYTGNGQLGWHPDFWTNSGNPMNTFGPGSFDSLNACEGNSFQGNNSDNNIVNGVTTGAVSPSSAFSNLYDGSFHLVSMVLVNGGSWGIYIDGVFFNSLAFDANHFSKPQYALFTSHVISPTPLGFVWLTENFSLGSWTSAGASMQVDYIRVWRPNTALHYTALAAVSDLQIDYNGIGTITLPSVASLWGDATVSEYVQFVPAEVNSPGCEQTPLSYNIYNQFPPGISYNSGTRVITADFSQQGGSAGVMHGVIKAWHTNGATCEPARFTVTRGPHAATAGANITTGSSASVDLYTASDVGIATPKTISVSGLPPGMSFSPSTGLATGVPTAGSTATVLTTNNLGQSVSSSFMFNAGTALNQETFAVMAQMPIQPTTTTRNAIDACITSLKSAGLWTNINAFVWFGLASSSTDSASCLVNWKGNYWRPSLNGTPTLTAYQGFLTNGTSNGIDTGFNPSLFGTQANNMAFSVWSNTTGQTATGGVGNLGPTDGFSINIRNVSDLYAYRCNDGTADTIANASGTGFYTSMRSGATTKKAYKNGTQLGTTLATAFVGVDNSTLGVGQIGSSNSQTSFSARQWGGYVIRTGSFLDADELALYNAINTLNSAVGP